MARTSKKNYNSSVYVCVCVCVCARARACVYVGERAHATATFKNYQNYTTPQYMLP